MNETNAEFAPIPPEQALNYAAYVDLDLRDDTINVTVTLPGQNTASQQASVPCQASTLRILIENLRQQFANQPILWTCEAGRTGYFIYRQLTAQSQDCQLVAPGLMTANTNRRSKRDANDAAVLATDTTRTRLA